MKTPKMKSLMKLRTSLNKCKIKWLINKENLNLNNQTQIGITEFKFKYLFFCIYFEIYYIILI